MCTSIFYGGKINNLPIFADFLTFFEMASKYTFKQRFGYFFDNTMSKGPIAMIGWLALISFIVIVVASVILISINIPTSDGGEFSFGEGLWQSLMHALDSGAVGGDQGWTLRILMLIVTFGGIFIVSTLIGILSSGLESRLEELRKGKSLVLETNHTLILGWSPKIIYVLQELIEANSNKKDACIVIMSEVDKVEMEDIIRNNLPNTKTTRIICRSANPCDLNDLDIVNPNETKSIIVLSPAGYENPDAQVIKTIVAICNNQERRKEPFHIVAEINKASNVKVTQIVGKQEVEIVLAGEVISSIMVQTCRQAGLSMVFTELLDFGGDEMYYQQEPSCIGKQYQEITASYAKCAVMGIITQQQKILLNPAPNYVFQQGEQVIVIAEDDDKIIVTKTKENSIIQEAQIIQQDGIMDLQPENFLLLGWNERGRMMIEKMDKYVVKGSTAHIIAKQEDIEEHTSSLQTKLQNITITTTKGDITDRNLLEKQNLAQYHHLFLLAYSEDLPLQEADAVSLITLLHLRDIADMQNINIKIASEILDVKNRELATITNADDFIVSENFISLMLTQVAENKKLNAVFKQLFSAEGSEITMKPATLYIKCQEAVSFYTLLKAAHQRQETAIGYKIYAERNTADKNYGVYLNPLKSELIRLQPEDSIIVLSEH